jgi:hypothetical protein
MTAIFLYLVGLFVAFALLNVLLHREVRSERRRERAAAGLGGADTPRLNRRERTPEPLQEGQRNATRPGAGRST